MLRALAMGFIALEALAAFWLFAVSRHGPAGLAWGALIYFVVAACATWALGSRARAMSTAAGVALVLGCGCACLALAPALLFGLDRLEMRSIERRLAATVVRDVRDEPILGREGRPVGLRLSFRIEVPDTRAYGIGPSIRSASGGLFQLYLAPVQGQADGQPWTGELTAGAHELRFDCYPAIVWRDLTGELRLSPAPPPEISPADPVAPLRVEIAETPYGAPWRGGREERTRGSYSMVEMYRAAQSEFNPD